jgi:hypothetical protein
VRRSALRGITGNSESHAAASPLWTVRIVAALALKKPLTATAARTSSGST